MAGVLFLCIHNAGRSQMAAGFARAIGGGRVDVFSGGSEPAEHVNPMAVEAMREVGIDVAGFTPQKFTDELLHRVDVVVTMGCGDTCPYVPGKRYIDWPLDDPKGQPLEVVRRIRDDIRSRVEALVAELTR
ncbi:MAG: arsenate reductase ArsC [Ilumatobacteraceae bacterium]|jgi:arsenate reductase